MVLEGKTTCFKVTTQPPGIQPLTDNGNMGAKSTKIGTKPTTATTILHVVAVAIYTNNYLSYSVESVNFNSSILQFFNEFFCEHLRPFLIQVRHVIEQLRVIGIGGVTIPVHKLQSFLGDIRLYFRYEVPLTDDQ